MSKEETAALIERAKGLSEPDRDTDLALTNAFDLPCDGIAYRWGMQDLDPGSKVIAVLEGTGPDAGNPHFQQYVRDRFSDISVISIRPYTASIDAVCTLIKRRLPKSKISLVETATGWAASVLITDADDPSFVSEDYHAEGVDAAPTLILAFLIALEGQP